MPPDQRRSTGLVMESEQFRAERGRCQHLETDESRLTVDVGGRYLRQGGRPVFLLADTLWAAFSRMTAAEWQDALRLRRRQGFNAVNVSVVAISHERSLGGSSFGPFAPLRDGGWDLDRPDLDYFARARSLVASAHELGLTVVLVVLWCTYVPGTWGAARAPGLVMNERQTRRYLNLLVETFADLHPVFCVSG